MYTQPFPLRLERSQHVSVVSCLLWLFSSELRGCCVCGKLMSFRLYMWKLFENVWSSVRRKCSSRLQVKEFKGFPPQTGSVFLQILAFTEPIMCIDWILLACLHLQMAAGVLFHPEKAGFCSCQHIKKGHCGYFKLYKNNKKKCT